MYRRSHLTPSPTLNIGVPRQFDPALDHLLKHCMTQLCGGLSFCGRPLAVQIFSDSATESDGFCRKIVVLVANLARSWATKCRMVEQRNPAQTSELLG